MFIQQKQLSVLNVPSSRVAMLYRSVTDIQLALPEMPSQMASAFMVLLKGPAKVQVLVALHLVDSAVSLFYLSDAGEVAADLADRELEAGLEFAESMGFVLNDAELDRIPAAERETYWKNLPICKVQKAVSAPQKIAEKEKTPPIQERGAATRVSPKAPNPQTKTPAPEVPRAMPESGRKTSVSYEDELNAALDAKAAEAQADTTTKRQRLKESLGRFLASM